MLSHRGQILLYVFIGVNVYRAHQQPLWSRASVSSAFNLLLYFHSFFLYRFLCRSIFMSIKSCQQPLLTNGNRRPKLPIQHTAHYSFIQCDGCRCSLLSSQFEIVGQCLADISECKQQFRDDCTAMCNDVSVITDFSHHSRLLKELPPWLRSEIISCLHSYRLIKI